MRKCFLFLTLVLISTTVFGQKRHNKTEVPKDELVLYSWKTGTSALFGAIQVPTGFTENTRSYREGVITQLKYSDGSVIILHRGGMMQLPLFEGTKYIVSEKSENLGDVDSKDKIIRQVFRSGKVKNKDLFWREENTFTRNLPISLNIGYDKVPKKRVELFNQALDSYSEKAQTLN